MNDRNPTSRRFVGRLLILLAMVLFSGCTLEEESIPAGQFIDNTDFDDTFDDGLPGAARFAGKKWLVIGDSISVRHALVRTDYEEYASEWLGCSVMNVAAGGTGYMQPAGTAPSWLDAMASWPEASEVDFITVMGALNDAGNPLGGPDDRGRGTFYGTLDLFYSHLAAKYRGVPVGVITSTPRNYCHGEDGQYVGWIDAVRVVAARFSLPVLDLYRISGLEPWTCDGNEEYFIAWGSFTRGDGVHPNTKGHFAMAKLIYPFIVENLGP